MSTRLWIREPSGKIQEHTLTAVRAGDPGVRVGRDAEADLVLADPAVSRFHAALQRTHEGWKILDLGSSNQTFVNGDPVKEWFLQPGDLIGIGDCELHLVEEVARVANNSSQTHVVARLGKAEAESSHAAAVLDALHELSRKIAVAPEENTLVERATRILVEKLDADRGATLLLEGDSLLCQTAHSRLGQAMRGFVLSQTIYQEIMQTREAILSRDTTSDTRFQERASVVGEEIRSVLAAPIRDGDQIAGIIYLDRIQGESRPFLTEDLYGIAVAAEFLGATRAALSARKGLVEERDALVQTIIETNPIVGNSAAIQRVRDFIRRAAPADSTVLVLGETGTGKELVAQAIHYQSGRRGHPFVAINCAAIPESLVESELFGHEKGSFTGAFERKIGKFEAGNNGTVFLDEIGELPLSCQGKLLRLLEEQCFERVGGNESIAIDVRIVAATNRDLAEEVEQKNFREDLFYRLNVLQVMLPPLADRPEDVALLIEHFLDHYAQKTATRRKKLAPEAHQHLVSYSWPGNVRQLRNVIESCVVMAQGNTVELADLPSTLGPRRATEGPSVPWQPRSIQDVEREHIQRVLDEVQWNKSRAAEILGIERSTLYARIKSYELKPGGNP